MKQITINIDGKKYPVKYGYGAIRLLGDMWGLKGYAEVVEKVGGLVPEGDDTAVMLKFENLELLADVILAGISNAENWDRHNEIERDTVINAFFDDMDMLKDVFELFMASMPRAKEPVEPPKKKRIAKTGPKAKT